MLLVRWLVGYAADVGPLLGYTMDHHHVQIAESFSSCAILELSRMGDDNNKILKALASRLYHPARGNPAAIVTWSTTTETLAWHIAGLFGTLVYKVGPVENPKTGNQVMMFTWIIPHEQFRTWYKAYRIASIERER